MAIVLPIILTFLFGLTEFGRAIWTKATLDYAVESAGGDTDLRGHPGPRAGAREHGFHGDIAHLRQAGERQSGLSIRCVRHLALRQLLDAIAANLDRLVAALDLRARCPQRQ